MNFPTPVDTRFRGYDGGCVRCALSRSLNSYASFCRGMSYAKIAEARGIKPPSMPFRASRATMPNHPAYIFIEPRIGYRMPKGETQGEETQ